MNKLRKFGFLVLAVVCALFIFAGCKPKQKGPTAEQAAARISTTVDKTVVSGDFVVNNSITLEGVTFTVTWESNNEIATIGTDKVDSKGNAAENGAFYIVKIAYSTNFEKDQDVTLTATVANGEDKATKTISFTVPKFKTLTYAEFAAADDDTTVTVDGIVTGIISKDSKGNSGGNCLYVNALDKTGGFYVYGLTNDPVAAGIKEGMQVRVSGQKDTYSGTLEIVNATVTITNETIQTVEPVDLTEAYKAATSLADEALTLQALLVTIKGVTITSQDPDNGYYRFKLGELESYIRISGSVCPIVKADSDALIAGHTEHTGWTANVTGVVCVYSGNFYLTPVSKDAFEYISLPELSDADQAAHEKEGLELSTTKFDADTELTLPVAGKAYTGVSISWTCESEQVTIDNTTGKATITLGEEKVTTKLIATLTKGETTLTKEIEITISAASKDVYVATPITAPVAGTFVIIMDTTYLGAEKGKVYYFNGELNDKGALKTSTNATDAAEVVVEAVEGGYALKVGDKYLEGYVNGSYKNLRFADTAQVWKWNSDIKTFTFTLDGVDYYVGDRDRGGYSNDTLALNDIKYATGDNLSKVGKSQFVGYAAKLEVAVPTFKAADAAEAGKFLIAMDTTYLGAEKGKIYYFDGTLNDKGALKTTTNISGAAEVVVEAVEGGYALKVGDKYLEGYVNGSYKNLRFADTAQVWKWNSDIKTFTFTLDGVDYYVGDRDRGGYSNDTMALNDIKYATGDNLSKVGKSQFVGQVGTIVYGAGNNTPSTPEQGGNEGTTTPEQGGNSGTTTPETPTTMPFDTETTYTFGFNNGQNTYYITGELSGNFGATTTTIASAAAVKVEAATNGYYLTVTVSGAKKYINLVEYTKDDGSKSVNVKFEATASTVYSWNSTYYTFTAPLLDTDYYMGTYNTFTTLSASKLSYASGSNNYPARLFENGVAVGALNLDKAAIKTTRTVNSEITLESKGAFGSTITWTVKSGTAIAINNGVATVTQPAAGQADATVVLTATLTVGETTQTVDVTVTVKAQEPAIEEGSTVFPSDLAFTGVANKASADDYWAANYSTWTISGKLGQTYGGYSGFGRSGDGSSSITSSKIQTEEEFTITTILKGNGSSGVATSYLVFELVDANGNVVATGKAQGASDSHVVPADGKDTTYTIEFTLASGKTWSDVSNLKISFTKVTGNIGLKSLTWNK